MKKLDEKLSLLRMAQAFGVAPDPKLLEEIDYLQKKEAQRQLQQAKLKERVHVASQELFKSEPPAEPHIQPEVIVEQNLTEKKPDEHQLQPAKTSAEQIAEYITRNPVKESTVVGPEPALVSKLSDPITKKVDLLEKWISRIAATGPGGGAGDVVNLDYPVKTITVSSYTVLRRDHYLGINVGTSTTIILPLTGVKQGRNIIVKDESGHCSINPITITGTIDNDTSGAT